MTTREIFIGYDPKEEDAYAVCEFSIRRRASCDLLIKPVKLSDLRKEGLYTRRHEIRNGVLYDVISDAPMSTQFAITRFLVPFLAETQYPLFMDADMLILEDIEKVWQAIEPENALTCVKHSQVVDDTHKMDRQPQTQYHRKNWSSFCVWNTKHCANDALTVGQVNEKPGRWLHAFSWLSDDVIGEISPSWNWLEGYQEPITPMNNIHFTRGGPWFQGCQNVGYADIWLREQDAMLGQAIPRKIVNPEVQNVLNS